MSLQAHYDKLSLQYSLNGSIAFTVAAPVYACMGVSQFLIYFRHHDSFYLFVGPFNFLLGVAGTVHGAKMIHAVVRRLIRTRLDRRSLTTDH
jgi:hypothetical protein